MLSNIIEFIISPRSQDKLSFASGKPTLARGLSNIALTPFQWREKTKPPCLQLLHYSLNFSITRPSKSISQVFAGTHQTIWNSFMLPKRQLKCVCKLPHVAQSTAASSPSYDAVFPNTRKLLGNHQLAKAKKGPLGGFLSSHPQIGPFTWGLLPKTKNKAVK